MTIEITSRPYVHDDLSDVPEMKVALVPGTTRYLRGGQENLYFKYRIDAAERLYEAGKVSHFLISGDHGTKEYNEPQDMLNALTERGIPESVITLDYAGFDTYDSMIRAKEVFGQDEFIVVTQEFQNERGVYIAQKFGINAHGFNAQDVSQYGGFLSKMRELLARVKAFVEVKIGKQPTFLGDPIEID